MKAGSQAEETDFNNVPRKSTWEKLLWLQPKLDCSRKYNQKDPTMEKILQLVELLAPCGDKSSFSWITSRLRQKKNHK